jgi:transposase
MKSAVTGEDAEGHIVYNRRLVDFARHHGYHPKACRPYRAKTTDEIERMRSNSSFLLAYGIFFGLTGDRVAKSWV